MVSSPLRARSRLSLAGINRGKDLDVQAAGVVLWQVGFDLLDQVGVVGAVFVQPEDSRGAGGTAAAYGQLDPVLDGQVFGLAHAEDVASFDAVFHQHGASFINNDDAASGFEFKGFVVAAVFFGLLCHQANVGHGAHGGGVEGAVLDAVSTVAW